MTKVVVASGDDWQGVYVDDKLVFDDHRVFTSDRKAESIFSCIPGVEFSSLDDYEEAIYAYLDKNGGFPEQLSELMEYLVNFNPDDIDEDKEEEDEDE